jgi:hypothetical protein
MIPAALCGPVVHELTADRTGRIATEPSFWPAGLWQIRLFGIRLPCRVVTSGSDYAREGCMSKIRLLTAAAALAACCGLSLVAAPAASADTTYYCGGDVCGGITASSGNVATVRTYPPESTFTGYFQLQTPNNRSIDSITSTWHADGTGNYFNNFNTGVGQFCVSAYETPSNSRIGYVCWSD